MFEFEYDDKGEQIYHEATPAEIEALTQMRRCLFCGQADFDTYEDEEDQWHCDHCQAVVSARCSVCGGEGIVEEDEYHGDWINYGHNLIACPECQGKGRIFYIKEIK